MGEVKHIMKEQVFKGKVHDIRLSEPVVYVDNKARKRSGHMTHALLELEPGKLLDFNSNCSGVRCGGHSAFGYVEYRYSEDYGETFGDVHVLPYSMETFMDGVNTISVEKAILCDDGTIVAFCLRNTTFTEICAEPFDTPTVIRSFDGGKTWTEAFELSEYKGRVYDAVYKDGSIYALEHCNDVAVSFGGSLPEHVYRLYRSDDGGASFYEVSVVGHASNIGLTYGALIAKEDGSLVAYGYNINDEENMSYAISRDNGNTWCENGKSYVAKKIRNPQIGFLDGQYILHGRAGNKAGFVFYTSADGLEWDEGHLISTKEEEQYGWCYYSNNIVLDNPYKPGKKRMLVQYSELYKSMACVDVMHLWIESET